MLIKSSRAVLLGAVVAMLPLAAAAEGHTGAFPGNKGYVGHSSQSRPVTNQHYHGGKYAGHSGLRSATTAARAYCPPKFYGMYAGTTYCQNGVALPN